MSAQVFDAALPRAADVVVIGGGIVGASTTLFLAHREIPTLLCEKGRIGAEQSSRNWGWVRKMGRDPRELPLMLESERLWQRMNGRIEANTGYVASGITYLCRTEKDLSERQQWLAAARPYQIDSRIVRGVELERILPGLVGRWTGALHTASDGRAEPGRATLLIAAAASRRGAVVKGQCAVRGLDVAAGRVAAVVTEHGRVACNAVVLAAGAWSSLFCRNLGVKLPQLKVRASAMRLAPFEGGPEGAASGPGFAFRKRRDGGYTVANGNANRVDLVPDSFRYFFDFLPALRTTGRNLRPRIGKSFLDEARVPKRWPLDQTSPFEHTRILDPAPDLSALAIAERRIRRHFPAFRAARVETRWAGCIDVTPDSLPVISAVDAIPGLFIATGFSGHGFGIGPGAGQLAADLVTGKRPCTDPRPFRLARFRR